jgi:hypothetical protein
MSMENDEVLSVQEPEADEDLEQKGSIIWNYYKVDGVQSKRGGAKNVTCTFCDTAFTGCSSSRAFAHILGRAVLGQKRANVGACVPIRKDDDNRYAQFRIAQKALNKEIMTKERQLSSSQAKQSVLDLTSPGKRTVTGEMKIVESKTLDSTIANFIYENALSFHVADTQSFAAVVEQCIELCATLHKAAARCEPKPIFTEAL